MKKYRASKKTGNGGGGIQISSNNQNGITVSMRQNKIQTKQYTTGYFLERDVKGLTDRLDNTKSYNGTRRIYEALQRKQQTIQNTYNTAMYNRQRGITDDEDIPSLKLALGTANRAVEKARKKLTRRR